MKMNRRTFQRTLLLAAGAGLCSTMPVAYAAVPAGYKHRLRFFRQGGAFHLWIRVVKASGASEDVPFTLLLSSDAQGKNVVLTKAHVARAASSHLVRGTIDMTSTGWTSGSPLFARFLVGEGKAPTKVRRLRQLKYG
jgi:hypothetical protein